jgi:hypothetical protein
MGTASRSAIDDFLAWLWVPPPGRWRARGFATVRLAVFPGRLVVTPRFSHPLLSYALGIPSSIEYDWPAVAVELLRPTGGTHVLLDIDGKLGAVAVGRLSRRRLTDALSAAGFVVVQSTRWGWEAPRPLTRDRLGTSVEQVPASVAIS